MNKPKNILILHCDQLRWDCLGYAGNPDIRTPNIDALAADSVNYTNQFTVYPICTPSRYSLWSGMYVHQHGAWNNRATLPAGYRTLPQVLRENGFDTAVVGKMHFTPDEGDGFPAVREHRCDAHRSGCLWAPDSRVGAGAESAVRQPKGICLFRGAVWHGFVALQRLYAPHRPL